MRFLSLALLSGCALVDASGDPKGGGDGGTGPSLPFERGPIEGLVNVTAVSVGQLDETTEPEVVALRGSEIVVCKNRGAGMFNEPVGTALTGYSQLVVDDLDGDGLAEIIVAGDGMVLDVFKTNGTGGFELPIALGSMSEPSARELATGSFPPLESQSSRRGIVASYNGGNRVRVFARVMDGGPMVTQLPTTNQPADIAVANVAGDVSDEVVVSQQGQPPMLLEFSVTNPTVPGMRFVPGQPALTHLAAGKIRVTLEEDLVYATQPPSGPTAIGVKFGSAVGLSEDGPMAELGVEVMDLATGDFNNDGVADVVALVRNSNGPNLRALRVFLTVGGQFSDPVVIALDGSPDHLVVANLNSDGVSDILVFPNLDFGVDVLLSR